MLIAHYSKFVTNKMGNNYNLYFSNCIILNKDTTRNNCEDYYYYYKTYIVS